MKHKLSAQGLKDQPRNSRNKHNRNFNIGVIKICLKFIDDSLDFVFVINLYDTKRSKSSRFMDHDYSDFRDFDSPVKSNYVVHNLIINFGECGIRCVRSSFLVFNVLFWTLGVLIFSFGVWLYTMREDAPTKLIHATGLSKTLYGPMFLVLVGIVSVILTFLACFGMKKNNVFILSAYSILMFIILASECAAIVVTYIYRQNVQDTLQRDVKEILNQYKQPGFEDVTKSIDSLQQKYQCCGNNDYKDWFKAKWNRQNNKSLPLSCCFVPHEPICNVNTPVDTDNIYKHGCYDKMRKYVLENLHVINGFGIWIATCETLGIMFSIIMISRIRNERRRVEEQIYQLDDEDYFKDD